MLERPSKVFGGMKLSVEILVQYLYVCCSCLALFPLSSIKCDGDLTSPAVQKNYPT